MTDGDTRMAAGVPAGTRTARAGGAVRTPGPHGRPRRPAPRSGAQEGLGQRAPLRVREVLVRRPDDLAAVGRRHPELLLVEPGEPRSLRRQPGPRRLAAREAA